MAKRIIIHPGFPKSGTTALQASLMQAKSELASQGIVFNPPWNNAHHRAAWALTNYMFGWDGKGGSTTPIEAWTSLCSDVKSESDTVLITSEFFIRADLTMIERVKADLGIQDIKIVFTLRPFAKVLPSRYQQTLKKGKTWTYDKWLHTILDGDNDKIQLLDYAGIIESWAKVFGASNVDVILADESNPEILYRRFENAISVASETLKPAKIKRLNRSLTASEVEILRQVNLRKPKKWKWEQYRYFVRGNFVKFLSDNPSKFKDEEKLRLPTWAIEAMTPYAKAQISKIDSLGLSIQGDIGSLFSEKVGADSTALSQTIPVEMAADLVIHLSSISRFAGTSTKGLVREIGGRLVRSPKFASRIVGKIILIFVK